MRFIIDDQFWDSFIQLPRRVQKKVSEFLKKFRDNRHSHAINLESIATFKDPSLRTARVDLKYRAIIGTVKGRDDFFLLWVDNHDEAMAWAENKTFQWNSEINSPQLYTIPTGVMDGQVFRDADSPEPDVQYREEEADYANVLSSLASHELMKLSVPEEMLPLIREIKSLADLEVLEESLPKDAFEHLFAILEGQPVEEILKEIEETEAEFEEGDSPAFKRFYIELDEELLEKMLSGDMEKWSIFLHPSQQYLAYGHFKGPVKVTGGAGTGKTVAAMHRLKHLCDKNNRGRILFATYTHALCNNLNKQVGKLDILNRCFDIQNIDRTAWDLAVAFRLVSEDASILNFPEAMKSREVWDKVIQHNSSGLDADYLDNELNQVIHHHNVRTKLEYLTVSRTGMKERLSGTKRKEVWDHYQAYMEYKKQNNLLDRLEIFNLVANYLNDHPEKRPYSHVILDEVQDCSNVEVRFVRSLAAEGPDDLFLIGDPYQDIYQRKLVFSQAGVSVRGMRSRRLKINYRTTEEIRKFAVSTLRGVRKSNFENEEESLKGYVSVSHGTLPEYQVFQTIDQEWDFILQKIEQRVQKEDLINYSDIVLAARTRSGYRDLMKYLHAKGIPYFDVREESGNRGGVHLCTFHSLKGLEYKIVFMTELSKDSCPHLPSNYQKWNADQKKAYLTSERSLLYTAMTRAIMELWVTGVGTKSAWIMHQG
jgi:superfamily I DNA/RNA helicase